MPETTLVLALEGDVTLDQFSEAVNHFHKLLLQLSQEVAADTKIEWDLEDLQYGSAIMAVAGRAVGQDGEVAAAGRIGQHHRKGDAVAGGDGPHFECGSVHRGLRGARRHLRGR